MKREGRVVNHGTISTYQSGCRCAECRAANTSYGKSLRHSGRPVPTHLHGTFNAYLNYACRCDACRTAQRDHQRRYRAKKRAGEDVQ